ncbi:MULTISPECIES: DUF6300 family protein [Streptomyces]|uniref:DUF6300 family protein n=1 Tax=Streptomyces TaxID=1883 RepID=UPI001F3106B5|nr:DUF6300 family protein [Streptomyces noursei]MCE4946095.1 DUF6300 family protein [Streptomyces noursei]
MNPTADPADSAAPSCPRCRTPVLLVVRHPHTWHNRSGAPVHGLRESVLCPSCAPDDPTAAALLALLGDGDGPPPDPPAPLGPRLYAWLAAVRARTPCAAALADEESRWRAGEL